MVTENVNIQFRESGARVIKRKIDDIGNAANRATRGIFLLQRALFVVGGAGLVRGLVNYADALTNIENRLRLTSSSTANLEAVQDNLFAAASRSRTGFRELADVYSRVALSTRQLGVSQEETIAFTESLAKASIISGASAREANAALVQLGQGLASNRLSGDELRSVLEQLPFVADVIAKQLGITRGELREFGRDGKISAEVVLDAFKNARDEIDRLFAQTQPTIAQAFTVANNNLLQFIDRIDDATGASAGLANAIIKLSQNIDVMVFALSVVAARFAGLFAAGLLARIASFVAGIRRGGVVLARFNSIQVASAAAQQTSTAATLNNLRARQTQLALTARSTAARLASAQAEFAEASAISINGRARDLNTGRFISAQAARARLTAATVALNRAEAASAALTTAQTRNRAALTAAETAATASRGRLTAATAAQAGFMGRLANTFPLLAGGLRAAATAARGLFAILVANPIGALITLVLALVSAFVLWGNEIKVTSDGVVGLRDYAVAAFQLIIEWAKPTVEWVGDKLGQAWNIAKQAVADFVSGASGFLGELIKFIINGFTFIPRVIAGFINGTIRAFQAFRAAGINTFTEVVNVGIAGFEKLANAGIDAINSLIKALNALIQFVGADAALEFFGLGNGIVSELSNINFDRVESKYKDAATDIGEAFKGGFSEAFNGLKIENLLGSALEAFDGINAKIIERARANIAAAEAADITRGDRTGGGVAGSGSDSKGSKTRSFAEIIAGLEKEIALQQISNREREIANGLIDIEKELKRSLTEEESKLAGATLRRLQAAEDQARILEEIRGPQEEFRAQLEAINVLLEQGRINAQEYAVALRDIQEAADKASNTFSGGFRASISEAILTAGEFGEAVGGIVVGGINKAADAIVEFAQKGKLNLRQLFSELFSQLLKLAAQQLLLQLVGSLIGVPGVGLGGGVTGGGGGLLGGLLGFAGGGSIMPTGPGSTDSQVVQFAKRPDERVDILTPGQQAAQANALNGGQAAPPVVNNTTNVAAVLNPSDIVNVFDQEGDTVVVNILQRNASTVRSIVQG